MATTHEIKLGTRHTRKQQQPRRRCTFVAWLLCSLLGFVATAAQAVHLPAPTVEKAFSPTLVAVGGTSRMTITLTNNNSAAITAVQFTDSYPNGMANTPVGTVVADNTCGGTVTADPGGLSAALSNGTIPAQGSCEVVVNVNGTAAGAGLVLTNHTGPVFSANAFGGVEATADLSVSTVPLMQAPTVMMTALPASITVGGVGSMFVVLTNPNIFDITDAQFTINYPTPLHIVNAPGGAIIDEDTCAVVALAVGGGSSLTITGATIPGGSSCAFILSVTGTTAGDSDLDTGLILSSNATPGVHAAATLSVVSGSLLPAPRLAATFSPTNIKIGGTSQLAFTFVNEDPNNAVTGLQQANLYNNVITNAPNALVSNTCGGLVILHAHDGNANDFQLLDGTIPPGGSCSVIVNVVGVQVGNFHNTPVNERNGNAETGSTASADVVVTAGSLLGAPTATKAFAPTTVAVGAPSQMTITLNNANSFAITGAQFTDNYPDGMVNASSNPVDTNTCGGTVTADPNGHSAALINGTIPAVPLGSCKVVINVVGAQAGSWVNQTGTIPAANALTGASVFGALTVTATPQTISFTSPTPANARVGDAPYAPTAQATSNLPVTLTIDASSGMVCAISPAGLVTFADIGTCTIDANQGGDATFAPAPQVQQSFAVAAASGTTAQTITFTSTAPAGAIVGDPDYLATALATSGQPVVLTIDAASQSVCTINAGLVHFIGMGTCTVDANQGGNAIFAPAPQVQQPFTIAAPSGVAPQTITFTSMAPINAHVVGPAYLAIAQATSGQPVILTIDSASATVCTISAGTVNFIGIGTCTIDANQGGNANFAPAPQAQQSFAVATAGGATAQTITFTSAAPINAHVVGPTYLATAQATSGQPVVLTIDSTSNTVCTISADTVYFIGAGACTIDANQGGDVNFAPASQVQQSFAVATAGGAAAQTITFTSSAPVNAKVGDPAYLAAADATSGQPVVLTIDSASVMVCTISADTVQFIGIGTCTIDANQGGDATYAPAPQVQQWFAVGTAGGVTPQTIAFTSTAPANAIVSGTYLATAQATPSGLTVVLTIDAGSNTVCTINNGTVMFVDVGTCTIDANQGGDATYAPAAQVQQAFAVASGAGGGVPIAIGDEIEVTSGGGATTLVGDPNSPSSVLDNDANVSTAELVSGPSHASAFTLHADGTFVYTNNGGTSDSFTYRARNAQLVDSNVATVTITIGVGLNNHVPFAVGDAIEVASGGLATTLVGNPKVSASVLDNDSDPDANDTLTALKLSDPTHGTLTLDSAGTFSYHNDGADPATSDGFLYQVCDNHGACDMGTVTITIGTGLSDHLPIVVDDAIQTTPNGLATTLIGDLNNPGSVLDNDSDPDAGDTLTAVKASALLNASGDLTFHSDGTFSYHNTDPTATTDSFLYDACDQHGACKAGIVTITITNNAPDLPPIAMNDAILVGPNGTMKDLVGDPNVTDSLLDNDSDVGDTLKAFLISAPANGDATVNPDGTFTYTNTDPSLGTDSFEYEACDSYGACTAATVSVTIDPTAPTVSCVLPPQLDMVGDTINVDLSLLFAPPPGKTLSYSVVNPPPPSSIIGSLLTGMLDTSGIYMSTLKATTVPGGVSSTEDVMFQVLPAGDILLRTGFEDPQATPPCQ